jgi:hypothetical protein
MAKHGTDPVLHELVRAVNESGQARVPVTVSVHGTAVTGMLIAQDAYFAELAEGSPLLSALTPASGLLGKDYTQDVGSASDEHLHVRAAGRGEGLWRISLDAVDAWTAGTVVASDSDKGPFARLLSTRARTG